MRYTFASTSLVCHTIFIWCALMSIRDGENLVSIAWFMLAGGMSGILLSCLGLKFPEIKNPFHRQKTVEDCQCTIINELADIYHDKSVPKELRVKQLKSTKDYINELVNALERGL